MDDDEDDDVLSSPPSGDRNPRRCTMAPDDDDVAVALLCCAASDWGLIENQDKIKCLSFVLVLLWGQSSPRKGVPDEWYLSSVTLSFSRPQYLFIPLITK